ncbi:MAG: sulfotransferase [Caulobacteraceae bacterium]|nr:sulfotransferase [Caulobacteraceae bacterium]
MTSRKIIAISGSGRTGSTLLSLLLSQHKDVFNLGQLRDLWSAWRDRAPCSCGHGLRDCPVYGAAVAAVFPGDTDAQAEAMRLAMQAFFADAGALPDWADGAATGALAGRHTHTLERLAALLHELAGLTGADAFVDASKSPEMALAFDLAPGAEPWVLNLARDPRAVAHSWVLKRGGLGAGWKYSRVWARRQRRIADWGRALGERLRMLRYETFTATPRAEVQAIAAWAGAPLAADLFEGERDARVSWAGQHLYPPANERVLGERREHFHIAPSEGWRDRRNALSHLAAMIGSYPEGWRYVRDGRTEP